ncbi:hypothetical protein [Streptomyces sp. NPDC058157]|uniref:hypothetical protein n=1 Tax=Streptomyces sp. NPDC058157 TaxID=3346360 RepID=UPI0036F064A5
MLLSRPARLAAPALAALTLTTVLASPASAAPAIVSRDNNQVVFTAQPGATNTVTFSTPGGWLQVEDKTSRMVPGSGCSRFNDNPHIIRCGHSAAVTRLQASLGDRDDVVRNETSIPGDLTGGPGDDMLIGGSGPDRLIDSDGWNAPAGSNTFEGRGGNDTIISRNGGYDRIDCGESLADADIVLADQAALDHLVPNTCEYVQRG